jgi:3-oxoacyl-[acyl-carrier protein] reductase
MKQLLMFATLAPASGGSINPGMVVTEGAVAGGYTKGDMRKMFESQTPLGRVGETQDIVPAAVFFASDDSKWVTGETLLIAGGLG